MGESKVSKLIALFEGRTELPNNEAKLGQLEAKRNAALEALDDAEIQLSAKLSAHAEATAVHAAALRALRSHSIQLDEATEALVDRRSRLRSAKIEGDRASSKKWASRVECWTKSHDTVKKRHATALADRETKAKAEAAATAELKAIADKLPKLRDDAKKARQEYDDRLRDGMPKNYREDPGRIHSMRRSAKNNEDALSDGLEKWATAKERQQVASDALEAIQGDVDRLEQSLLLAETGLDTARRAHFGPLTPEEKAARVEKKKQKADAAKTGRDQRKQTFTASRSRLDAATNALAAASDAIATALDQIDKLADAVAAVEADILKLTEISEK